MCTNAPAEPLIFFLLIFLNVLFAVNVMVASSRTSAYGNLDYENISFYKGQSSCCHREEYT